MVVISTTNLLMPILLQLDRALPLFLDRKVQSRSKLQKKQNKEGTPPMILHMFILIFSNPFLVP